ncbi:MAG: citrate synthase [Acidobacteria bacterium]|nr:MAG: citrate synthase [Acidobacteriota bacterium]
MEGAVVADSSLCFIDGQKGQLVYRGYDIHDLAGRVSFEETAWLLWNEDLPTRSQLQELKQELGRHRALPGPVLDLLRVLPDRAGSMETLRSAISLLATLDPEAGDMTPAANRNKAARLTAAMPTILAAAVRRRNGEEPVDPDADLGHAANFLWMLNGRRPSETAAQALDMALVLHAEHGFNASTFSARVTAATLSDLHSAVISAISTLKGPLHGGANREVMETLETMGSLENVAAAVRDKLSRREKIMGFGHRVYKTMDPRAVHLKKMARDLGHDAGDSTWYDMSALMEETVMAEKGLYPNVDFYSAAAYRSLGIPAESYPAVFACSRISGWTAHIMEQYAHNRLIRPRARYTGPMNRTVRPLSERG